MTIPYRFAPWARRGLARAHANPDAANAPLATRPRINVGLTLQAKRDGVATTVVSGTVNLALYGPADVIGIDQRLIVRTDPKPDVTNFEPNYLAIVDFDPPDFPWLLTSARANDTQHLRPWLVLVVVERAQVAPPSLVAGRPLPSIKLTSAQVKSELPDLGESWLWAHTQAISEIVADSAVVADTSEQRKRLIQDHHDQLSREMNASPARNISRLICPRRLEPQKRYVACVVPATDGGRLRGLHQPFAGDKLGPAWTRAQVDDLELPVYYHWEFSTSPEGDIESLARLIRTPQKYAGDADLIGQLEHIGQQVVTVDGDHLLYDGKIAGRTVFEGAMVSLNFRPEPEDEFRDKLVTILNSGHDTGPQGAPAADKVPTLSPPIYGEHAAKRHVVDGSRMKSDWLNGLNLQPRYRLAAGWGAEVVRQNQDEFMQAAWEQVGEVLAAERALSLARLSHDVLKRIQARHLDRLSPERLLAVMAPSRARIKLAPDESLYGRMAGATLPQELFDGAMRRLTSARRPTFRMAQWRERNLAALARPSITLQMNALVATFANASKNLDAIDPNRFVPDGLTGSRSYDAVPLPANLATLVDLKLHIGLDVTMTGAQLKAIQQQNVALRKEALATKKTPPAMGDVWHEGLLTETHARRFAELQSLSSQPLEGDIARLIQQSSKRGTEGVLLSVQDGKVTSQALRIDARSGALKAYGSALTATRGGRAVKGARLAASTIAAVPRGALKLYGNTAVFTSLPPSTLGQGGEAVHIGLAGPGDFSIVKDRVGGDGVLTITMPPALKDRATLGRYSDAFRNYRDMVAPPAASVITLTAVDFATAAAAAALRSRADPAQTVPARLASMLTLGGQSLPWTGGALSNAFIGTRLDPKSIVSQRYSIPRTFDRVMAYPHLLTPLSRKLEKLAPEVFLPGVGVLPNNFIMALQTNPRFIEALMLGANHEMGRELLWQGFPTDQRGTPFQHFWQRLDPKVDIEQIDHWNDRPLGAQREEDSMLVLLVRGQLLERFPTLSVYAYPFEPLNRADTRPGATAPHKDGVDPEMIPSKMIFPVLRGHLNQDISYIGFPIDPNPENIVNYFFIIEEHMTEPRFGFDEPDPDPQHVDEGNPHGWLDIDWKEVDVRGGKYFGSGQLKLASPATGDRWIDPHAATVADALLQRPFRGYWKGEQLKMPKPPPK